MLRNVSTELVELFFTQLTRMRKCTLHYHYNNVLHTQDGCLLFGCTRLG